MEDEQHLTEAEIYAMDEPETKTVTKTFQVRGNRKWTLTIESGGHQFGERWHELYTAVMYGQTQKQIAQLSKKEYEEKTFTPTGKQIVMKDPSYVGSLKLLEAVLVKPKLSFGALAVMGHKIGGKAIDEIAMWAAAENGVTDFYLQQMAELSKNLNGAAGS